MIRRLASLPWLRSRTVRQLHRYYQGAMTSCRPFRLASLPSLGGTSASTRSFCSPADECAAEAWSWWPGISGRDFAEETTGPPKFLENPNVRLHMFSRLRRDCDTRPLRCRSMAPDVGKAKTPAIGLSELNSMAFGLAVYASQCGLPTPHARLAPGRWSGVTGRAFHPQGSDEGILICFLHLFLPSQASWRNR